MAQFTIYRSTDSSAPVLTGAVGDLVNLLDKCLVAGYGSKSAAGWTKAYTGTNKAAFQQGSGSNSMLLRVQDDAAVTAKEARLTMYETMSSVDAGTGSFPSASYLLGRKSNTADATARAWIVIADARTAYVGVLTGDVASTYFWFMAGEFYSLVSSDNYRVIFTARGVENSALAGSERFGLLSSTIGSATSNHYVARGHTGLGGAIIPSITGDAAKGGGSGVFGVGGVPFTNPADGALMVSPLWISDPTTTPVNGVRGRLRGIWHFLHPAASVADGDTFSGVGDLSGKTFLCVKSLGVGGVLIVETSNTVETN